MTKKVKLAIAVDIDGNWCAMGWSGASLKALEEAVESNVDERCTLYTIEVNIPVIDKNPLKGKVF